MDTAYLYAELAKLEKRPEVSKVFQKLSIGAAITLITSKPVWKSGMRQVLFGLAAAAVTYGIGYLVGVNLG